MLVRRTKHPALRAANDLFARPTALVYTPLKLRNTIIVQSSAQRKCNAAHPKLTYVRRRDDAVYPVFPLECFARGAQNIPLPVIRTARQRSSIGTYSRSSGPV